MAEDKEGIHVEEEGESVDGEGERGKERSSW